MQPEIMISISTREYNELCNRSLWLDALESAGVDNWEGYDEALNILQGWEEDEK